ncbi:hypothetical protein SAMN05216548_108102 [Faunimonas pinastri]|uniref:Uncharacterized protein n=1 Tax=Faunimonas pinastri TaxID=1855383 RepID=A0A1H9JEU0_9HYPH|nr:hypothetical protein [Faunimonas pinastri]SEQ85521.1 hypothetical protein SAMN05216548_108102 [Faunimonas pinastri]
MPYDPKTLDPDRTPKIEESSVPDSRGDYRGAYGYGRRAHGSDPNASYGFQPSGKTLSPRILRRS